MNFRPGVSIGMQKLSACRRRRRASGRRDRPPARRQMAPASPARGCRARRCRVDVSSTLCSCTGSKPTGYLPLARSTVGVDDGVGERDVLAPELLLVADEVLRALLVAVDRPFVAAAGKAREGDVHVVRRAAHQADGIFGDPLEARGAASADPRGARDHVADVDRLAGLRDRASGRHRRPGAAGRRPRPAPGRRRPSAGWSAIERILSPPTHSSRPSRKPCRNCFPVRAAICRSSRNPLFILTLDWRSSP